MKIGAFSVSLSVQDLQKSEAFYRKLGFDIVGGDVNQNWLIIRNGDHTIGLFQGMFEGNMMTFNPGWSAECEKLESFDDIREIHQELLSQGVDVSTETLEGDAGPASFSVIDPDGNSILFDQHV